MTRRKSLAHGCKIGGDVDGIGHEQRCHQQIQQPRGGSTCAMLLASPRRVSQPMQALMIWIAAMNGSVRNTVQSSEKPNCAPACE